MTELKIIEEMAKDVALAYNNAMAKEHLFSDCIIYDITNELIAKNYRKASEVVAEVINAIHEEIRLALDSNYKAKQANGYGEFGEYVNGKIDALRGIDDFLDKLEEKYKGEQQ